MSRAPLSQARQRAAQMLCDNVGGDEADTAELSQILGEDLDMALATQLLVVDERVRAGDEIAGWKVGLTSGAAHDLMGPGFRPFGYLLRSRVFDSGTRIAVPWSSPLGVEPEIALVVARDITAPLGPEEARRQVASVHAAFEINQFRLGKKPSHAMLVADNLANWGIVLGEGVEPAPHPHRDPVSVDHNGRRLGDFRPTPMDDPYQSLATLTGQLTKFGRHLRAGDIVITGSFSRHDVTSGDRWAAEFRGLASSVQATFT